ncbi:MAG TPA: trypsin-like serine protease [Dyella sp.]|uniref:trypsin-like serine protease n=1 Tax=Dyella sp. TaxID=1869338 RepID=UPI002D7846DE|nr:trypsin-like serine protease [Dyella sp.]HET6553628.1 trypsin-like serine protease [Dyella sp.]
MLLALALGGAMPSHAVEVGASFQTSAPTNTGIAGWSGGWSQPGVTGWDYVGQVNGASGVYLGNGWVLTAGHVGQGTFTLDGNNYAEIAGSSASIGNADLSLFQIDTTAINSGAVLSLPTLTLSASAPTAYNGLAGSTVVVIGYGGSSPDRSWGVNTVTQVNQTITLQGTSYSTTDFLTLLGTTSFGSRSVTNDALLVAGDSGGGDFILNPLTGKWELAGINEAVGTTSQGQQLSAFVQLSGYEPQIEAIVTPVPLPGSSWLMLSAMAVLAVLIVRRDPRRPMTTLVTESGVV